MPAAGRGVAPEERHGLDKVPGPPRVVLPARGVLSAVQDAEEALKEGASEPSGPITLTAPVQFGQMHVAPAVTRFALRYPKVKLRVLLHDRVVNLLEEGVDVAIRIAELPDSSYRALRVGSIRRVLCAAPDYLAEHGIPQTPDALANNRIILARGLNPNNELRFQYDGQAQTVKLQPLLSVSDNDSAASAAMAQPADPWRAR